VEIRIESTGVDSHTSLARTIQTHVVL